MVLKKEVMKTQNKDLEKGAEYRHLLVHAIHECAANFPDIAANVIHLLMDFLGDTNSSSALDVVRCPPLPLLCPSPLLCPNPGVCQVLQEIKRGESCTTL